MYKATSSPPLLIPAKILDKQHDCLIDSGASISLFPTSLVGPLTLRPTSVTCTAANGGSIKCFGEFNASVALKGLRRVMSWTFVAAEVPHPILGLDFLSHFKLAIGCASRAVVDTETKRRSFISTYAGSHSNISFNVVPNAPLYVKDLFSKYQALTSPWSPDSDPSDNPIYHRIETGDALPTFARPRPLPPDKLRAAKAEFSAMLEAGIVRPSNSPWAAPLHMVPKKEPGQWRPCGDFRALNSISRPDRYPLPHIKGLSHRLHGSSIFSKIDLLKAYHQVRVQPEDVQKTAVTTPFGMFEYLYMPYGLRNAGATFQRYMDSIFRDIDCVFVYMDDLQIHSSDEESHKKDVETVLSLLASHGLRVSVDKCEFTKSSIDFLGFTVSASGLTPPASRTSEISGYPLPQDSHGLRRFLGIVNYYRRLIPHFADLAFPMTELIKAYPKAKVLTWPDEAVTSFENVKQALADSMALPFMSPTNAPLQLVTDASGFAVGAALHQMIDGSPVPITFFSKKLSDPQKKYSAFDRELLAAYMAVLHFKELLEGRTVVLCTDHKPLVSAFYSRVPAKMDRQ